MLIITLHFLLHDILLMQTKLTFTQLSEAFPEEIETLVPKIIKKKEKNFKHWKECFKNIIRQDYDIFTTIFIKQVLKIIYCPVKDYNYLLELKRLHSFYLDKKENKPQEITKEIIEACKQIPIEMLYQFERVQVSQNRIMCKCPLHAEKHPSFVIYRKTNSFYCFSCKFSGDTIEFVRRITGLEFIPAIKYLKRML